MVNVRKYGANREARIHMADIGIILRNAFKGALAFNETGVDGLNTLQLAQNLIITPALKVQE